MTTQVIGMTDFHQERRKNYLGASEIPAVLGLSPGQTSRDIYHLKVTPMEKWEGNDATEAGHLLEPMLIQWAGQRLGVQTRSNVFRVEPTEQIHSATLDAQIIGKNEHIQAKSVGIYNSFVDTSAWGDDLSSDVPRHIYAQVQQEMLVTGHERVWIPAFFGNGEGFKLYRVERDEEMIARIWEEGLKFWREHVLLSVPPPEVFVSEDTPKRFIRKPGLAVELEDIWADKIREHEALKAQLKEIEARQKQLYAEITERLGEAEIGKCSDGTSVTYKQQGRDAIDEKRLKLERPDLFDEFKKRIDYRVLRCKPVEKEVGDGEATAG